MRRSIIDRIFPPSAGPILPQHEQLQPLTSRLSSSPTSRVRIPLSASVVSKATSNQEHDGPLRPASETSTSSGNRNGKLQSTPLSASVLHYDDPFLPVERAARALQESIQSLLDVQSRALSGRMNGAELDETMSTGSLTPTQSSLAPKTSSRTGAVPIRQPLKRKIGLRGARKGLTKKMHEFAGLREQELQVLDAQSRARTGAIQHVEELEAKKHACEAEVQVIDQEETHATVSTLRAEARTVESEIEELEHKLLEMRVKHRYLLNQANQLESSLESKMSSFKGAMLMVDKETREFLRRPPVAHALADGLESGMYALNPERRTLQMAKEQWISEQDALARRKVDVENERDALLEGGRIWSNAAGRIELFEQHLRRQTAALATAPAESGQDSMASVLRELGEVIESLEADFATAESNNWNLLICAVGAELEAFRQAREMLEQTQSMADNSNGAGTKDRAMDMGTDYGPGIHAKLRPSSNGSDGSNESLRDTIQAFSDHPNTDKSTLSRKSTRYESEDDEPPVDFLLSR